MRNTGPAAQPGSHAGPGRAAAACGAVMAVSIVLGGCSHPAPSTATPSPAGSATVTLDPYFRGLRTAHVESDVGDLTLLFDTGGGATLVTPGVAARMGCQPFGRDVGYRMSGERVEFSQCDALSLRSGGFSGRVEPVGVFDVNALLPEELPRLDGVLALDAFRGRVITLDWPAGHLQVHAGDQAEPVARASGLTYRAATGDTGRMLEVFLPVAARRGRLWFLLDSGDIRGTLVSHHVPEQGLLEVGPEGKVSLAIGGRRPLDLVVEQDDLAIDGALGTAYLMNGPVTLDLRLATAKE